MNHPILKNRSRILIWGLAWLLVATGQSLLLYEYLDYSLEKTIAEGLISAAAYSLLALTAWFPIRYFDRNSKNNLRLTVNLIAIMLSMTGLWLAVNNALLSVIFQDPEGYSLVWDTTLSYRIWTGLLLAVLVVLSYYLIISYQNLSDKKLEEARLENLLKETELQMLRTQINPHFLFNSLNSVNALTISDPARASEMVIRLSDFMRYALSRKDDQMVKLRGEMDNLSLYLEIEKTRFGDRLSTEEDISDDCLEVLIPSMLLQPLYENAVKFGLHESTGSVLISTAISCDEDHTLISIINNFDATALMKSGTGTGLTNIRRRLDLIYGGEAVLNTSKENGIFTSVLRIPNKLKHEKHQSPDNR